MNLTKPIIFVILLFPVLTAYAQECKARIDINTDISSSKIYIDNDLIGNGSAEIELPEGEYQIRVINESDRWDARLFSDTLQIENCNDTTLTYAFNSEVYLNTEPQDVYVFQDSELVGHTPLFLTVNSEEIVLKKPGFEDKVLQPADLKTNEKIRLNFIGEPVGKDFFERNVFKILVGGIVALGGVTAYFKLKADNYFDKYLISGDDYYLDQTHKFDLISGIAFGALQVSFGFLIYYFLSD